MNSKNEIRNKVRIKRGSYTLQMIHFLNQKIRSNLSILLNFLLKEKLTDICKNNDEIKLFIYLSMFDKGEVDTWSIIDKLQKKSLLQDINPNITIYVPKIINNEIIPIKYVNSFTRNKYGIMECENKSETEIIPNIIIVPLLAFNIKGDRVGYGGGYYDKYLTKMKNSLQGINCVKVGLCFENHTTDVWNIENHDVKLDYIVTSTKVYEF